MPKINLASRAKFFKLTYAEAIFYLASGLPEQTGTRPTVLAMANKESFLIEAEFEPWLASTTNRPSSPRRRPLSKQDV